ncbi:MAG: hypothetical protein ACYSWU_26360, partial [Planctomycetota bacterium]
MASRQIFSVGFAFPGNAVEHVGFLSDRSLLDADVVLYRPSFDGCHSVGEYQAKPCLTESSSFRAKQQLQHWKSELQAVIAAGKVVIVYLAKPEEVFMYTGQKE